MQDTAIGKHPFPFLQVMPLPSSILESSHRLPGLESAKQVKLLVPPAYRLDTAVPFGSKTGLHWEEILQFLLLILLEFLSPFCFFYNEKSLPFCRVETK